MENNNLKENIIEYVKSFKNGRLDDYKISRYFDDFISNVEDFLNDDEFICKVDVKESLEIVQHILDGDCIWDCTQITQGLELSYTQEIDVENTIKSLIGEGVFGFEQAKFYDYIWIKNN